MNESGDIPDFDDILVAIHGIDAQRRNSTVCHVTNGLAFSAILRLPKVGREGNQGHLYSTTCPPEQKDQLLEYLRRCEPGERENFRLTKQLAPLRCPGRASLTR